MLPFMREQGYEEGLKDSAVSKAAGVEAGGGDKEADEKQQEYLSVATQGKDVRKSTIILCVLFGVGLLCLFFMIRKSSPQSSGASQLVGGGNEATQIERAIARLTGVRSEMFKGIERIVKKFYEFSDVKQVPVGGLAKNPFMTDRSLGNVKQASGGEDGTSGSFRDQQVREQSRGMQLLSIMASEGGNCCMIDNKILYEGDSIRGFKVLQIDSSFVKLKSDGVEVVLNLSR